MWKQLPDPFSRAPWLFKGKGGALEQKQEMDGEGSCYFMVFMLYSKKLRTTALINDYNALVEYMIHDILNIV